MRKILALTLVMVLAMAGMASAAVTLGGSFKVEYVIDTDYEGEGKGPGKGEPDVPVKLTVDAEDEGVWDLSLQLKADAEDKSVKVGDWTFNLNDELFSVELWGGGVEKAQLATPLKFVKTDDPAEVIDTARMRLSSDVAGLVDVTIDYEPVRVDGDSDVLYVFASKAIDDLTVGGAIETDLNADGMLAAGYVKYVFGPATLTGEVAVDTAKEDDNLAIGGSVSYKLTDQLTLRGKATHKDKNFTQNGEFLLEAGADYEESLFKVSGTVTRKDDLDNDKSKASNKLKASVTYRSNDDVAYGDLFDNYTDLTGYAAFAEVAYTTATEFSTGSYGNDEPTTELTLKGAGVGVPGLVWLYGEFIYAADKDGDYEDEDFELIVSNNKLTDGVLATAKDYMRLNAEATVKVTDKLSIVPSIAYGKWNELEVKKGEAEDEDWNTIGVKLPSANEATELELGAALTYALSDAAEVGLSYTNRTQEFKDDNLECKDSFLKVYFSTSF